MRAQELPPGRAVPSRRGIDARPAQDLIHGGRRDRDAQLGQLAVNTAVTPERVLLRQADGEPGDAPDRRRAAGPASSAGVVFPGGEPAVPGQQRRGMNRVSAVNEARSPGSYRIRPAFRRSTAFSCRSASSSAFFARSPRNTSTVRPNNQRISRQTLLSSTRSANHHRTSIAGQKGRSTTRSSFRAAQDQEVQ